MHKLQHSDSAWFKHGDVNRGVLIALLILTDYNCAIYSETLSILLITALRSRFRMMAKSHGSLSPIICSLCGWTLIQCALLHQRQICTSGNWALLSSSQNVIMCCHFQKWEKISCLRDALFCIVFIGLALTGFACFSWISKFNILMDANNLLA